jgi:Pyruvate/2-oxoacid:ferredoxin oxidoreductase delta subunit
MKREIIKIDEDKCTGCGLCIPNCPEGAIQIIDGKAKLLKDLLCDGLGACLGHCPEDAITIEEREAEAYDEEKVMENIITERPEAIRSHLKHLQEHKEVDNLQKAINFLKKKNMHIPFSDIGENKKAEKNMKVPTGGCLGSRMIDFSREKREESKGEQTGKRPSELRQWPIQLHLVSPLAPYFQGKDVLIAADCVAFTVGDFHKDYLKGKSLAIACPKLDQNLDIYKEKLTAFIDQAKVNTITVMTMEVPCCSGLLHLVKEGAKNASRKVPIKHILVSLQGDVLSDEWGSL